MKLQDPMAISAETLKRLVASGAVKLPNPRFQIPNSPNAVKHLKWVERMRRKRSAIK